jgi:hypothetical protein
VGNGHGGGGFWGFITGMFKAQYPYRVHAFVGGGIAVQQVPHGFVQVTLTVLRHCQQGIRTLSFWRACR